WRAKAVPLAQAQQIAPTASPQGDRYYVKATWDPANASTVDCLASLFNKELITNRTLDQERSLMKNRKARLVYGYDKEWGVGIAGKIKACGGSAAYVHPTSGG